MFAPSSLVTVLSQQSSRFRCKIPPAPPQKIPALPFHFEVFTHFNSLWEGRDLCCEFLLFFSLEHRKRAEQVFWGKDPQQGRRFQPLSVPPNRLCVDLVNHRPAFARQTAMLFCGTPQGSHSTPLRESGPKQPLDLRPGSYGRDIKE